MKLFKLSILFFTFGCFAGQDYSFPKRVIPAEEFSRSLHQGNAPDYSIYRVSDKGVTPETITPESKAQLIQNDSPAQSSSLATADARAALAAADPRYADRGLVLKESYADSQEKVLSDGEVASSSDRGIQQQLPYPPQQVPPQLPPGSMAPYATGQMTNNPSLWPDEAQGASLFTDFRAFQAMDVITVQINESSVGNKKTKTDTEGKFSLIAGIEKFFGIETKSWASNNASLDPAALVSAEAETKFEGEGETKREGKLKAQISAVILEVLPNNLLRIEGSKIVSVDSEEEVMVISGLVRIRDINSQNQVDSNRIANMRIDFYGKGVLADHQEPGWGSRLFNFIWPF